MKLTDVQANACQALQDELLASSSAHQGDNSGGAQPDDEAWQSYLEDCIDPSDDLDDEIFENGDMRVPEEEQSLPNSRLQAMSWGPVAETPIQARILELLIALYTHLPTGGDDKFFSPVLRFLVLFSRKKTGQWSLPRQMTQFFATLLFCGREVMMALMQREVLADPDIRYSQCVFCHSTKFLFLTQQGYRAYDKVASFMDDDYEGPIPSMYILMRPLNRFSSAEGGSLRFTATDFSGDNIMAAGRILHLRDIRYFVESLIGEIREQMRMQLFFGLDVADVDWSPGIVYEEPRNVSIGYSCFRDPHNSFLNHKDDLLQAVLTHPRLRGQFHYYNQEGQILWKAGPCFEYMEASHDVEMMLFCGTQTSVGEPGRGTEIASHLISNVSGGSIRNVFILFQYFCMMGTFNKTSHFTERDATMMRVPHPEIGRLWVVYLTFVRPLLVVWQRYFHGRTAATRATNHLFFGPHRPVTSSELSRSLSYHSDRLLGVKISISLWRHISTWFLNYHSVRFHELVTPSDRSALAAQSGHNVETHALYAPDARLPGGIDFHVFFSTMRISGAWHNLLNFRSTLARDLSIGDVLTSTSKQLDLTVDHPQGRPHFPSAEVIAEAVRKLVIPDFVRLQSQTRANDLASLLDAVGCDLRSPSSHSLAQPVTYIMHPSRLLDLRKFLADDCAAFKHTQQALATELIASKNASILLIGPTGKWSANVFCSGCMT
jgi:hypothetical protein